jgi:hypothetical protein
MLTNVRERTGNAEFDRGRRGGPSVWQTQSPLCSLFRPDAEAKSTRNGSEPHCDPPARAGRVPSGAGGAVNVLEVEQGCCQQLHRTPDGNKKGEFRALG